MTHLGPRGAPRLKDIKFLAQTPEATRVRPGIRAHGTLTQRGFASSSPAFWTWTVVLLFLNYYTCT